MIKNEQCYRCAAPLDEDATCSGSGFTLNCASCYKCNGKGGKPVCVTCGKCSSCGKYRVKLFSRTKQLKIKRCECSEAP